MMKSEVTSNLDRVILSRCTTKVLSEEPLAAGTDRGLINAMVSSAGCAPFHRRAASVHLDGDLNAVVPWRFYVLDSDGCRTIRRRLIDDGNESKIPKMLATATCLIQVTWLPNPPSGETDALFEPSIANMEHIAAAASAVQNLLLAATARGLRSFWSSGGVLREAEAFRWLGIPGREILLGSVFLFPPGLKNIEELPGGLREQRGNHSTWARWIKLDHQSSSREP